MTILILKTKKLSQSGSTLTFNHKAPLASSEAAVAQSIIMKKLIQQLEREAGIKPGALDSAIIIALCIIATPIILILALICG